jgi:transcriptional regulator with GAF, ATPase, and Fis domain
MLGANLDENEFFRDVTLRLCGSLEIEEGLRACVEYLADQMPAESLYLEWYEEALGAMHFVARATAEEGKAMDLLVPLDQAAKAAMAGMESAPPDEVPSVFVVNLPEEEPVTRCLLEALALPPSSVMSVPLVVGGQPVGALVLIAAGERCFTAEQARLYATLREPFFVAMSNTLEHREVLRLRDRLAEDNRYLHRELLRISGDEIIGADLGLREVMRQLRQVAPTESPVLLTGETGVGKDVIANAIHLASPRSEGPFIPVNCGAIPASLLDSELFGHEKGAFTGALSRKRGRFERADKGTILLDEIGEMPLEAQVRLLRVLQHREIERVGGTERVPVDIRIIAATNKDLRSMVQAGRFREDLWFRLNVFPMVVPPLRDRPGDIPALAAHFVERKALELKLSQTPELAEGALEALMAYRWPGNVRELENVVERAMILHRGEALRFEGLDGVVLGAGAAGPAGTAQAEEVLDLDTVVAQHIAQVLERSGGKIHGPGGAGELLGVNPNTLRYKMRKLGLKFRKDRAR